MVRTYTLTISFHLANVRSANLLYPEENKENQKLQYICRTCTYKEDAETTCIFRHELANTVGDTAGITQDIGEDPTVGEDSNDPNADFYASASAQHSYMYSSYSDMNTATAQGNVNEVLDMCTMCGQEIFCETCGQPSECGLVFEVDEDQPDQFPPGMMTPVSMPSEMDTSQQLQQLRLQQDQDDTGNTHFAS